MKITRVSDIIGHLKSEGTLTGLVKAGAFSSTVATYYAINERLREKSQRKRTPKHQIISSVAEEFRVDASTVYRAKKMMTTILQNCEK